MNFLLIIFHIVYFFVFERLFFIAMAYINGKACKNDCSKCKCWSCTHDSDNNYHDFIMRDYSKYCGKNK